MIAVPKPRSVTTILAAGVVLSLALTLAACSRASPSVSPASSAPAASSIPASPVVGVVTHVDASGLASVAGFTLRTADGRVLDLAIGTLENGAEFPPGHLAEHQATAAPVRVSFRAEGSRLVAYRIDDASGDATDSPASGSPAPSSAASTPGAS